MVNGEPTTGPDRASRRWRALLARSITAARVRARESERGIALLATLLGVTLMTILVVDFATSAALGYRSAANRADELRALYLARSGVEVGLAVLERDSFNDAMQRTPFDSLQDIWAIPVPPVSVEGGTVAVTIIDEARKIDINRMYSLRTHQLDGDYVQVVARLFENMGISTDLIPILADWLDPDSVESPGGAEADYYLKLMPPYEPRNGQMPTISDLRACKGIDDATFIALSRFLTTAPEARVNANTAPPEVLAALTPELSNDPSLVKEIIAARTVRPLVAITEVANLPGIGQFAQHLTPLLTTRSAYFTITGEGTFAGARRRVYAVVRRNTNGSAMLISWHED